MRFIVGRDLAEVQGDDLTVGNHPTAEHPDAHVIGIDDDAWFARPPAHLDAAIDLLRPGDVQVVALDLCVSVARCRSEPGNQLFVVHGIDAHRRPLSRGKRALAVGAIDVFGGRAEMAKTNDEQNGIDRAEYDSLANGVSANKGSERAPAEQHTEHGHDDWEMAWAEEEGHEQPLPTSLLAISSGRNSLVGWWRTLNNNHWSSSSDYPRILSAST